MAAIDIHLSNLRTKILSCLGFKGLQKKNMGVSIDILPSEVMTKVLSSLSFKDLYRCKGVNQSWYNLIRREFIIIEIFLHLPVKSLLSIRFASRYCYKLIRDIDFVKLHHTYQVRLNPSVILVDKYCVNSVGLNPSIDESSSSSSAAYNNVTRHVYSDDVACLYLGFVGSCHGLLCFQCSVYSSYSYVLYNPATEACSMVPSIPAKTDFALGWTGFGYDPRDDDYKILALSFKEDVVPLIYSFRRNTWRKTKTCPPPCTSRPYWTDRDWEPLVICLNSAFYWNAGNYRVVRFDLANERYHQLPMPPDLPPPSLPQPEGYSQRELCILSAPGGSYLHLQYHQPWIERLDLWIMKEDGVIKYYWEKLFSLTDKRFDYDYTSSSRRFLNPFPLAYLKRGSQILLVSIMRQDEHVDSLSYDFKTKKLEKTQIFDSLSLYPNYYFVDVPMVEWAESLFSIRMSNMINFG